MSLNRKYLAAMSVEGDVADQILTEHSADMNRVGGAGRLQGEGRAVRRGQ